MQKIALLAAALAVLACTKATPPQKPLSEPGETIYAVKGVIVGRDAGDNLLRVDLRQIPGYMDAMIMDYPVRGAAVTALPPDKTPIEAKLHVHDDRVWLTDVRRAP